MMTLDSRPRVGRCPRTNPRCQLRAQVRKRLRVQVRPSSPLSALLRNDKDCFAPNSQSFLAKLDSIAARCNYADYFEKHVTYPPKGVLPLPGKSTEADRGCDVWDTIFDAALAVNPAFNIYRIFDTVRTISPPSSPSLVLTKSLIVLIFPADAFPPF